ncbi:MAG: GIY-YIG nuclease family protein [Myroides sp.]
MFISLLINSEQHFYVGVSNDLNNRISQHNNHEGSIFTSKYNLNRFYIF